MTDAQKQNFDDLVKTLPVPATDLKSSHGYNVQVANKYAAATAGEHADVRDWKKVVIAVIIIAVVILIVAILMHKTARTD
jgi:uncharacterized membrane protein YvbJ